MIFDIMKEEKKRETMNYLCEQYQVDVSTLELSEKAKATIRLKPTGTIAIMFIVSVVLIITQVMVLMLLGAFFLGFCILSYFFGKDRKVIDVFEEYVIVYDNENPEIGYKINFSDITEWRFHTVANGADYMLINLENEGYITIDSYNSQKVAKYFMNKIPDKEYNRKILNNFKKNSQGDGMLGHIKMLFKKKK